MSEPLPYEGLRVLDVSQGIAGPYCASLLGIQGANVAKIEPPVGDWGRNIGGGRDGMTPVSICGNLNKRSAIVDAGRPEGRALLARMAQQADVLVQNFRPGVIERMGIGYDALVGTNPGIVFVSVTGFGPDGPESSLPATDSVMQSYTGIAYLNRMPDGMPRRVPLLVADVCTGLYAMQAVGAALYARSRTGKGRHVRVSLLESCAAFQSIQVLDDAISGGKPPPPNAVPGRIFRTMDDWLFLGAISEPMFAAAMKVLGMDDWVSDTRFATFPERLRHANLLNDEVEKRLAANTSQAWLDRFTAADVVAAIPANYKTFREAPQVRHVQAFAELDQAPYGPLPLARLPGADRAWPMQPAPRKGEHTREVLHDWGVSESEIDSLAVAGVVGS